MQIQRLHACTGHRASLYALAQGHNARHFLSAGGDGWIVEWNLDDPETGKLIANTETQVFSLCALSDSNRIVAGTMNGSLHWINRDQPTLSRHVPAHHKGVFDLLPLGNNLLSAGGDGFITLWDVEKMRPIESIQLSGQSIRALAYCPKRQELAVGASDNSIIILDAAMLAVKGTFQQAHTNSVFSLAYAPDGRQLVSGGRDAFLRVWDSSEVPEDSVPWPSPKSPPQAAHLFTINHLVFSTDGQLLASASRDKTIKIWDAQTFELLKVIDTIRYGGHINSVNRLLWLEDVLISVSDDRSAIIWAVVL